MPDPVPIDVPLACVPDAIPAPERRGHIALTRTLFTKDLEATVGTETGFDFRFPADALERVARFVVNERRCCPFLHFVIEAGGGEGPIWLRLTGPEGTALFLEHELPLARARDGGTAAIGGEV